MFWTLLNFEGTQQQDNGFSRPVLLLFFSIRLTPSQKESGEDFTNVSSSLFFLSKEENTVFKYFLDSLLLLLQCVTLNLWSMLPFLTIVLLESTSVAMARWYRQSRGDRSIGKSAGIQPHLLFDAMPNATISINSVVNLL